MADDANTELSDAMAALIAELPGDANDITIGQVEAVSDLKSRIADVMQEHNEAMGTVVELAESRGVEQRGGPIGNFLTGEEKEALERAERRALDAERARHALSAWEERAGWVEMMQRVSALSGVPDAYPDASEPPMILSEDTDGSIVHVIDEDESVP